MTPEKKEKKKQEGIKWRMNNPEKVKEFNRYHTEQRYIKRCETRKKELNYDNFEWMLIPDIKRPYYINSEGTIIDQHFKKVKLRQDRFGYVLLALDRRLYMYHRIIAKMFVPNPNNKPEVNHKNGIKDDNRPENLEWVTRSENVRHSFEVLKKKSNLIGWRDKKKKNETSSK